MLYRVFSNRNKLKIYSKENKKKKSKKHKIRVNLRVIKWKKKNFFVFKFRIWLKKILLTVECDISVFISLLFFFQIITVICTMHMTSTVNFSNRSFYLFKILSLFCFYVSPNEAFKFNRCGDFLIILCSVYHKISHINNILCIIIFDTFYLNRNQHPFVYIFNSSQADRQSPITMLFLTIDNFNIIMIMRVNLCKMTKSILLIS